MKLLTKEIQKKFDNTNLYGNKDTIDDSEVIVKYFDPCGAGTWYIIGAEKVGNDYMLFGYAYILVWETGTVMLSELENMTNALGLGIERDRFFPKTTIRELIDSGEINFNIFG
jgi:hypothetical protein